MINSDPFSNYHSPHLVMQNFFKLLLAPSTDFNDPNLFDSILTLIFNSFLKSRSCLIATNLILDSIF